MKFYAIGIVLLFIAGAIQAQQDRTIQYEEEYVGGVNFNTNAGLIGGGMFRYAKKTAPRRMSDFGIEIVNVKHSKEVRVNNQTTGNLFIWGKTNYLFAIRPYVAQELLVFTKGREDGIQINALFGAGPTLGLLKPYYIKYNYGASTELEQFDPAIHKDYFRIEGSGGMFTGLGNSKFLPGLHARAALTFEYGSFSTGVTGIEVGCLVEGYSKRVEILNIMAETPTYNRQFFSSLYMNIYFGGR